MITKHAIVYSVIIHILFVVLIIILKLEQRPERKDRDIFLDYTFIDEPEIKREDKPKKEAAQEVEKIPLPPVELPRENIIETASSVIIPDTLFSTTQSLAIMPRDSLTALDSLLLINPNLLAFRTVFMGRVKNNTPEDTSIKWKQIAPVSIAEYMKKLKYSDGFKNSQLQEKLNSGGIKIPLDAIFDLFK